ncbi:hypothetical protein HMJ40_27105 [Pseudomonas aeruginosa]|nr:hypothetical protein HMJ40_27105 [Pseudomonas aeruginosa]
MLFAPTLADKAILPTAWGGRYFFNRIGHQRTQGGLSATGRSMRHRWPSRRGSESARIDLRCPTSH